MLVIYKGKGKGEVVTVIN